MRFTTYTKYTGGWIDALNLENLMELLSDFLMDGGFAGGPNYHPYWGWSGTEDTSSVDALKHALLEALLKSGQLTPEMLAELRGEGAGDAEVQKQIAELLDRLIERMVEEGYISLKDGKPDFMGPTQDVTGQGQIDDAKEASESVQFNLNQKGMDFLGYRALRSLLGALGKASIGVHDTPHLATGIEAEAASRPYEFGDTLNLDIPATLKNAIEREGLKVPLNLEYGDLMVHQSEYRSSCATVLMLDISHSMVLYGEDRFSPAKRVALALSHLIRTQFPGDTLKVVTFGDRAQEIPLSQLAKAQVGPFHTNTAEGLEVARRLLTAQKQDMRQIIMITDGKPSAVTLPDGRVYTNSGGMDAHILRRTFREVAACRKAGILINTFMLARDPYLVQFVKKVSEIARGKAYFTSTMTLGQYIMMDFMKRKRRRVG
ncbi:MAG: VWA domain-containing protein [Gemmatimonadetes bacterium]|nr:VWA domain-containing protein [Gemmatimonadota bacterium]MBT8403861.1 VWA domain-containing protein [Gemmatimonadota bacterium]NNF38799.1 VWA domain-containing protein [Gemmatimonadota bacterium]NNK62124.1 VWA domain-containing protein [Gemmatimonadota bacterium]